MIRLLSPAAIIDAAEFMLPRRRYAAMLARHCRRHAIFADIAAVFVYAAAVSFLMPPLFRPRDYAAAAMPPPPLFFDFS